jgi:hypothetical protein
VTVCVTRAKDLACWVVVAVGDCGGLWRDGGLWCDGGCDTFRTPGQRELVKLMAEDQKEYTKYTPGAQRLSRLLCGCCLGCLQGCQISAQRVSV